jgi:NADPH-dependent 2,4-dienoyl-CoA reductase/sulfur reductase-like enzyme
MTLPQRTIVVVGGLAAGPSAASKAARTDPNARIILLEQSDAISYGICELPYYVGGIVREEDLVVYTAESLKREKGVDVRLNHRVEQIHPGNRRLSVRDIGSGKVTEIAYDRLVLTTGASARLLGIPGEDARNVFHIRTLDSAHYLRHYIDGEHPRRAVVIGAGYVGVEMAEAFRMRGIEVTLLDREELPLAGMADPARAAMRDALQRNGVVFKGGETPVSLASQDGKAATHVLTPHATYPADVIVIAAGVVPNTALAQQAGIRIGRHGGILTDQWQKTSAANIFAAGDCCEVRSIVTNASIYVPLATIASRAGWVAGTNAAGGRARFPGALRATAVKVFEFEAVRLGATEVEAREAGLTPVTKTVSTSSRVGMMPGSTKLTVTLIADKTSGRLLGGTLFGQEGAVHRGHALAVALHQRMTVDAFRETDFAYAPTFSPLWDPLLVAANALARELQPTGHS